MTLSRPLNLPKEKNHLSILERIKCGKKKYVWYYDSHYNGLMSIKPDNDTTNDMTLACSNPISSGVGSIG